MLSFFSMLIRNRTDWGEIWENCLAKEGRGGGELVRGNGVFKTSGIKYIRSNSATLIGTRNQIGDNGKLEIFGVRDNRTSLY